MERPVAILIRLKGGAGTSELYVDAAGGADSLYVNHHLATSQCSRWSPGMNSSNIIKRRVLFK